MKLATFTHDGKTRIGVAVGNELIDLSAAAPEIPTDMRSFLEAGDPALKAARSATGPRIQISDVHLEAPVTNPSKFLGIGLNYADHVAEAGAEKPKAQLWFNKQTTCVNPPNDPIHMPRVSDKLDYEVELGFIIGRRCRHVPKEKAMDMIAGFCIVDDVSVRDWQFHSQTMIMGKSFDTHGPVGPWIVTPDEIGDPHKLSIKCWVNDEIRQDSNTKELIFNCFEQIEYLTKAFTLLPGDIVSTGTPAGVAIGFKPPKYLKVGDVVRMEIEKIGSIRHEVVDEPKETEKF